MKPRPNVETTSQSEVERRQRRDTERAEARRKEDAEIERIKDEVCGRSIPRGPAVDKAWNIAWEQGHSEGMESVKCRFEELVEIIRLCK